MFRPIISAIIGRYYKIINGKIHKTEEEEEEKLHQLGHELFCDTIHS